MADDLNRLLIKIQADTSQLASALRAAETGVASTSAKMERSLSNHQRKFKGWVDGQIAGIKSLVAGYVGLEAAKRAVEALNDAGEINDTARRVGLTTDALQSLKFAAEQAGASTEDLTGALDSFARNMDTVRANSGGFNDFLKDQAPALRASLAAAKDQGEALNILSDFMAGLGSATERSTLMQEAFGRGSVELTEVMEKGAAGLQEYSDRADELGVKLGKDTLDAAERLKGKLSELKSEMSAAFETGAIKAAAALETLIEKIGDLWTAAKMPGGGSFPMFSGPMRLAEQMQGGQELTLHSTGSSDSRLLDGLAGIASGLPKIPVPKTRLQAKPNYTGTDRIAALNKQLLDAQGQLSASLQAEYDQELKDFQRMLDNKEISEQQFAQARATLGALMEQHTKDNLGAETQQQKEYFTATRDLIESTFMDSFSNALEGGKFKASEFFNNILQGFAKITTETLVLKPLLDNLFTGAKGKDGLGGILGSLVGYIGGSSDSSGGWQTTVTPARAAGGPGNSGKSYLVGEHGPEVFTPSANGSFGGSGVYARGNSSGGNVYNIDARGADIGVLQRVQAALTARDKAQKDPSIAVRQMRKRFPTR